MNRSLATPRPTFWYSFKPQICELKELNCSYAALMDEANQHEQNETLHDAKWDKMGLYTTQNNSQLQRESEFLAVNREKIRRKEIILKGQIEFLVAKVFASFPEMAAELQYDDGELSEAKFQEFLFGYKEVIEGSNNLPCYKNNPHFTDTLASINKYCNEAKN